jgi:hypothetical protein
VLPPRFEPPVLKGSLYCLPLPYESYPPKFRDEPPPMMPPCHEHVPRPLDIEKEPSLQTAAEDAGAITTAAPKLSAAAAMPVINVVLIFMSLPWSSPQGCGLDHYDVLTVLL